MSWVSLSGSEGGGSGNNSYKEVANQAFASPTNLGKKIGNRTPSKDDMSATGTATSRRGPSKIGSEEEAAEFHEMFNSTAVQVTKKRAAASKEASKSSALGEGLKALAQQATRQYQADLSSAGNDVNPAETETSSGKESFSLGSVSRRTKDLDLAHNDNSFHVIGGLIVEFFQSKQKAGNTDLRLTPQDIAQLDRLAPPRVRASFVEAVRFRFTNAPMDSTSSVHNLARQCHNLGLDADGPHNPLLVAAEATVVIPMPKSADNNNTSSVRRSDKPTGTTPRASARSSGASGAGSTSSYPSTSESSGHAAPPTSAPLPPHHHSKESTTNHTAGRPPRQAGDEAGASVSTRLTKMGVEMPYTADDSSAAEYSASHSQASSYAGAEQRPGPGQSVHGSVGTSLTKFGIEMPRYGGASPVSEVSVMTDMKSMTTSLTRLGVEMPLPNGSAPDRAGSSDGSRASHHSGANSPILSMCKTDESSAILPAGSSKDFGNGESLAKQQLMAELREASTLMAESKTKEAAKFWQDHVLELETRLRALNGDDASVASRTDKHTVQTMSASRSGEMVPESASADNIISSASPPDSFQGPSCRHSALHNPEYNRVDMAAARAPLMIDPSLDGVPMVDVVAPADLPGGYHFEAEIEGRRFLATVPAGGVQKGETFSCYMRDLEKVGSDIPVGRWRDGLFDCCRNGCCHPVIGNGLFCPLVLLSQIMSRVGFDFLGRPSLDNSINGPNTLWSILSFWLFINIALFAAYNVKWSRGMELSAADLGAVAVVNAAYILFLIYLTSATRGSLREKYYIRETRFHDLEDCCCATFCLPCSVCQMARHTADYDAYEGVCCNETGLPDCYEESEPQKQTSSYVV